MKTKKGATTDSQRQQGRQRVQRYRAKVARFDFTTVDVLAAIVRAHAKRQGQSVVWAVEDLVRGGAKAAGLL